LHSTAQPQISSPQTSTSVNTPKIEASATPQVRKLPRQLAPSLLDVERLPFTLPKPFLPPIHSGSSTLGSLENVDTIGITYCDVKGQLSAVNRAFSQFLGYTEFELNEKSLLSLISTDDVDCIKIALQQLVAGECNSIDLPVRFTHKRSHTILALATISILINQKAMNERAQILLQVQQVGRLRQFPEVLFADKEVLRVVFKELVVGCAVLDFGGPSSMCIVCTNPALCDMLGVTEEELGGHHLTDFIHVDDREKTAKVVQDMLTSKSTQNQVSVRIILKVGWISTTLSFSTVLNSKSKPFLLVVQLQPNKDV